ncbi:MAG: nicotinate-nucleotide adenylyltransferase [Devosia sp.]|jgi:nicotinate-nucleotide adenylyltransferase|uniref:nicotinate-nucleotide adenylyltransferase n=1 Tax=unclassified Devosia TaxID=196773 RepID=UPI0019DBC3F5|nr:MULTISPECIES: nicotinate-nucleotide adenylyltransferase [unclassified Devosia]MBF0678085.1 nicotinate-nucleotide adenylyltransferase [Devosia sp.]WEJ33554.1 nicotinate-nucleotide adenylyltransferase [Devosia sp. SD17-2]
MTGITELPPSAPGMRIGLFGGSFNPIHDGHVLVMEETLRRLGLDALWVLVTPGNPLKNHNELSPLAERVQAARDKIANPRIKVTGFEAAHGFTYTYETLRHLADTLADRNFVWIMGADSLADFHRWSRWREIAETMPIAVYVRPRASSRALASRAAAVLAKNRIDEEAANTLADRSPPAWVFLRGRQSSLSSSAIRAGKQTA